MSITYQDIIRLVIRVIDYSHKKKIAKKLKIVLGREMLNVLDVGAHHGESISFFLKNFNVNKIYSFEPSKPNYKMLCQNMNLRKEQIKKKIQLYNYGLGLLKTKTFLNQFKESSSSTIQNLNLDSNYMKKKMKILNLNQQNMYEKVEIEVDTLKNFLNNFSSTVDILKIDTEGYELNVIKGAEEKIKIIKCIYFEHHYDDMITKDYTFSDINDYLVKKNFKKIFKIKMPLRKTFEYIFVNNLFN